MDGELKQKISDEGYALIPGLLNDSWIDTLKTEAARVAGGRSLDVMTQLVHRSASIRDFCTDGPQIGITTEVLGPNICFTHQQFIIKRADEKARSDIPWHQDSGYGHLEPASDLTIWITLDDCDEDNGCLWVIPGSHRKGLLDHSPQKGLLGADVHEEGIPLPMRAGDAVVFGGMFMHRSLPNRTDKDRVAMYLRYCTPDVIMHAEGGINVLEDGFSWMVAGEAN